MHKFTHLGNNCIIPSTRLLFSNYNIKPFNNIKELTLINWNDMEMYKNLNTYYFPNLQHLNYLSNHKHSLIDLHTISLTDFMRNSPNTILRLYKEPQFPFNIYKSYDLLEYYIPKIRLQNIQRKKFQEITNYSKEKKLEKVWTKYIKENMQEESHLKYFI